MEEWKTVVLVLISILWHHSFVTMETSDHLPAASDQILEVQDTPGTVVLSSKYSTKAEFVSDNHDNPGSASRIVNHIPSSLSHHKQGTFKPDCARDISYCLYDKDYPIDKVHEIINNYHDDVHHIYHALNHYPSQGYVIHDNYTQVYRNKGNFVCESEVSYIRLGWAKNWKNEWVAVVNTEKYLQTIRVETCKFGGKKCEYLPPCYKSSCLQRYSYVKLLCVDPFNPHHRPIVDVFEIPVACSCFVESFVYY